MCVCACVCEGMSKANVRCPYKPCRPTQGTVDGLLVSMHWNYHTSPTVLKRTPAKVGSSFKIRRY